MTKRRLKVSVDTLLHHTSVPEPDLKFAKAARKQLYMNAVEAKYAKKTRSSGNQFWRAGQGALVFAGVGLFVLIGASSIIAMAGRAQPGDRLYSLNRAWERTQLALTQDEAAKLGLKLAFVEERLDEVAAIELGPNELTADVVSSTEEALTEIDDELDKAKLALEFGESASLSREQVDNISQQFANVVESYQQDIDEIFQLSENENSGPELAETALAISDIASSLTASPTAEGEGYYLQLKGELSEDGKRLVVHGYDLNLAGSINASAMANLDVKVDGWLSQKSINPELISYEDYQLAAHNGQTIYSGLGQLQQDETGYFVSGPTGQKIALTGEVSQDERLNQLVGQEIGVNATWKEDGSAELIHVLAGRGDNAIVIPEMEDPDNSETGESLPATDPAEPDMPPPGFDE